MNPFRVGSVGYQPRILVSCLRVSALAWDVIKALAMLPFVSSDHVDWLLEKVEVEVLIGETRSEIKVTINKTLRACIEQSIDIRLVPASLLDRLKFGIKIIKPLSNVSLVRF